MSRVQKHITEEERSWIRSQFFALRHPRDLALLMRMKYRSLTYIAYGMDEGEKYHKFNIPKKSGGIRKISSPEKGLKGAQRKLNRILQCVYQPKPSTHGFVSRVSGSNRSVVSNAGRHVRKRFVLNIDLKDFFPTVNFGRIYGMFMAPPYNLPKNVAATIAQLCTFEGTLPQGAPTSPTLTNMICAKMDQRLQRLAAEHRCTYTRYADDITFSTTNKRFPVELAWLDEQGKTHVGSDLLKVIDENGFEVNDRKIRLQTREFRQEVTGITVNEIPNVPRTYVRQLRAMLHAWERYGLEMAAKHHLLKNKRPHWTGATKDARKTFIRVLQGKLGYLAMIKGQDDQVFCKYAQQFTKLSGISYPSKKMESL